MLIKIIFFCFVIKIILTHPKSIAEYKQFFNGDENLCECLPPSFKSRVINGTAVENNDFRWVVAIVNKIIDRPSCTGTLLNHQTVLTAAHCFKDNSSESNYEIIVGLSENEEFKINKKKYTRLISKIILNPSFDKNDKKSPSSNDLAIIILDEKFELGKDKNILPGCIFAEEVENPESENYFFAGYGLTKPFYGNMTLKDLNKYSFAKSLNQINLEYDKKICDLEKSFDYFCLKNPRGSLCNSDSGGGSFIYLEDANKLVLVSTLASGKIKQLENGKIGRCVEGSSVYTTKIYKFIPWIKEFGNPICLISRNYYHPDKNYDY